MGHLIPKTLVIDKIQTMTIAIQTTYRFINIMMFLNNI